jgi:hypothetical protein
MHLWILHDKLLHGEITSSEQLSQKNRIITYLKAICLIVTEPALREMLCHPREYWILCRGPGFSRSCDLAPRQPPPPAIPCRQRARPRQTGRQGKWDNLMTVEGGRRGGRAAYSYDRKKAWSSINLQYSLCHLHCSNSHPHTQKRALPATICGSMLYLHHFKPSLILLI